MLVVTELSSIEEAVDDIRDGKMVIVVDEEDRENEGDLTMAAEKVTPEAINFMAMQGRGLVCLPLTGERLDHLQIPLMSPKNHSAHATAFCVSIEARRDVTTGISAADRATTVLTAIDSKSGPSDIIMPGHIFPLRCCPGGVLQRAGQTEAAVDLVRIAGLQPAGVICEIMNEDGSMARLPQLMEFSRQHGIKIISIVDLITFRMATERFVKQIAFSPFQCDYGSFELRLYENTLDGRHHLAFIKGDIDPSRPTLVRMHAESVLSDVFLSSQSDTGRDLSGALQYIEKEGAGVLVYLSMRDRERSLVAEVEGHKAGKGASASFREFGVGAQILADLGLNQIRLLSNHPKKIVALKGFRLNIVEHVAIPAGGVSRKDAKTQR